MSPHLDDAVLSIGATLHALTQTGYSVLVATVFAGDPPHGISPIAAAFHADCGLDEDAMSIRRAEDVYAVRQLGCQGHHLEFPDAIYRRSESGGWLCGHERAMFTDEQQDAPLLRQQVTHEITALIARFHPTSVLTCAAIGGHIDHKLTRDAATDATRDSGTSLVLWEDLPYSVDGDSSIAVEAAGRCSYPIAENWEAKSAAVACYPSQLRMLWPQNELGWRSLSDHGIRVGSGQPAELGWVQP